MKRILHDGGSYRILEGEEPRPVAFRIDGQIHEVEPGTELLAVVDRMHSSGLGRGRVELDLRNLAYVNATGLKALVRWVQLLQAASAPERYRLVVQVGAEHGWQRTSLHDLARLAGPALELVGDEPTGTAAASAAEPDAEAPPPGADEDVEEDVEEESSVDEASASGLTLGSRLKEPVQ